MKFTIKEKNRIFQEFFRVDRLDLEIDTFAGGRLPMRRYHLERPEVVALVLYNPEKDSIILVKQFRYSSIKKDTDDGWTLEIVGGLIDPGEAPEESALRESEEETGFRPKRVEFLTSSFASVGISNELIHLYVGLVTEEDRVASGGGIAHENEDILVIEMPFQEALQQIKNGIITDAKSILGIQWLALKLAGVGPF